MKELINKNPVSPVEVAVINKVTHVLSQLGLKFAIQDSSGTIHGELKPAETTKPKKKAAIYGYGVLKKHLDANGLGSILVNSHKVIPVGSFDPEVVRRSICSHGSKHWGNGTYKTAITPDRKGVEVTRFDNSTAQFLKDDPLADILKGWN